MRNAEILGAIRFESMRGLKVNADQITSSIRHCLPCSLLEEFLESWETRGKYTDAAFNHAPIAIQCCIYYIPDKDMVVVREV